MPGPIPLDDETIGNDGLLYLRVFPDPDCIVRIPGGGFRPNSGELRSDGALSVDLSSLSTPQQTRDRDISRPFHVAAIPAHVARAAGCGIVRDPLEGNPAHALLYGSHSNNDGSLTKSQAKRIVLNTIVVLVHPDAPLPAEPA